MESMAANDETLGAETEGNSETVSGDQPGIQTPETTGTQAPKPKPLTRVRSFYTPYMEDRLSRRLKFFFMGPHEKIKARRKCPWKLIIQVLKIILVTIQVICFNQLILFCFFNFV